MPRDLYTKYKEKFKKIQNEIDGFIGEEELQNYYNYLIPRIRNDKLKIYKYQKIRREHDYLDLMNIYLTASGNQNDYFEGLAKFEEYESFEQDILKLKNWSYLSCFSETPLNNLMWGHYADKYSGICVEYDLSKLNSDNIGLKRLAPILYSKKRIGYLELYDTTRSVTGESSEDWISDTYGFFFCKANYWKYEKEWRIVLLKNEIPTCCEKLEEDVYKLEFNCISSIYFGPRVKSEYKRIIQEKVKKFCEDSGRNIAIYEVKINVDTFDLIETKID